MAKIRVLVVDDAVVMRKIVTETLARDADLEVVGTAPNGKIALQRIPQVNPDVLTLDVEMPEMNGMETLREVRKTWPKLPIIMFSTLTQRGAADTLDALALGATDYVTKPANVGSAMECISRLEQELVPKIKAHCRHLLPAAQRPQAKPPICTARPAANRSSPSPIEIVCIGSSTGGPNALAEVFGKFPADFPVPIVIVQHMPSLFTAMLAERLTKHSPIRFFEGAERMSIQPGVAYIAPGGRHMEIVREGLQTVVHLQDDPPENSCRPAVDVLFRSVAAEYGPRCLGVILTGMGQDGLRGCELIRQGGGQVIAQDEATSVVWGMPGAVAQAGFAEQILPLDRIADEIVHRVQKSRRHLAA